MYSATSSSTAVPGLPDSVLSIYGFVQFFNLDASSVLHLECLGTASQFGSTWAVLSSILVASAVQLSLFLLTGFAKRNFRRKIIFPTVQMLLFVLLNCLYPLVAKNAIGMLHCQRSDEDGETGIGTDTALYLVNGPVVKKIEMDAKTHSVTEIMQPIRCWEGEHLPVGVLAVVVLCTYVIGYPIATYRRLWHIRNDLLKPDSAVLQQGQSHIGKDDGAFLSRGDGYSKQQDSNHDNDDGDHHKLRRQRRLIWTHFVKDFEPDKFYVVQLTWLLVLAMTVLNVCLDNARVRCPCLMVLLAVFAVVLLRLRPFKRSKAWKLPMCIAVVICTILQQVSGVFFAAFVIS